MTMFQASQIVYVYNQRRYVDEVVAAAFAQDYDGEMEILLSDDGSTDGSYERLLELAASYTGRHHVRVRRTPVNKGAAYHLSQAVRESQGQLIVGIAGDDIPLPDRVSSMLRRWKELGSGTALIYSDIITILDDGTEVNSPGWVYQGTHNLEGMAAGFIETIGASSAFTRDLIEKFPPFAPDLIHEDRVLAWRALLLGGVVTFFNKRTIKYRIVGGISRRIPKDLRDYLRSWSRHKSEILLPDARQRLADLHSMAPLDSSLEVSCLKTITDLEFKREFSTTHWLKLEIVALRFALKGARAPQLINHYFKLRLLWVVQYYSNRAFRRNNKLHGH